jgi:hypothetical protein
MSEVQSKGKELEHGLINSVSILFFENDSVINAQLEKYLHKVLYTKYEYNLEKKPDENKDTPHLATKSNFKNLMIFFK